MLPLRKTSQAEMDILGIWLRIAQVNPPAAERLLQRLEKRIEQLRRHPESGEACDDVSPGLRRTTLDELIVFYRTGPDGIEVARVVHGGQDLTRVFP